MDKLINTSTIKSCFNKEKLNLLSLSDKTDKFLLLCKEAEDICFKLHGYHSGLCIAINHEIINVTLSSIDRDGDIFYLQFINKKAEDEVYSEYAFAEQDIKNIVFGGDNDMRIIHIKLQNDDLITVHCIMY